MKKLWILLVAKSLKQKRLCQSLEGEFKKLPLQASRSVWLVILVASLLLPLLSACKHEGTASQNEPQVDGSHSGNEIDVVQIRLHNDADVDFVRVWVQYLNEDEPRDYGPLAVAQHSPYQGVPLAFRYAHIKAMVNAEEFYEFRPFDYEGETPLEPGYYSYALSINGDGLALELVQEQPQQDQ